MPGQARLWIQKAAFWSWWTFRRSQMCGSYGRCPGFYGHPSRAARFLGARPLGSYFIGLGSILGFASDLQFQFVTRQGTLVLGDPGIAIELHFRFERHVVAVHL